MSVDVALAGLLMDGTPDADGISWFVEDVAGWDSAPVRFEDGDLTARHGGYDSARLYAARQLTVPGWAECRDLAAAFAVRDRVHLLMTGSLVVHEPVPKSVVVVSGGSPRSSLPMEGPRPMVTFQIPLVAQDPFKRAVTATDVPIAAGQTVTVESPGTAAAELLVRLTSAGTLDLTAGGLRLATSALPSGALVDVAGPSITGPDGADLSTAVTRYGFPALPAGGGDVTQAGTANVIVTFHDTYA